MILQVKAVIKTAKIRRDSTCAIGIQYCFTNLKRVKLDSGIAIDPKYWNNKKRCISDSLPKAFGNSTESNKKLLSEIKKAEEIITLGLERKVCPLEFFKLYYKPDKAIQDILIELENIDKDKF